VAGYLVTSMAKIAGTGDPYEHLFQVQDMKNGGVGDVLDVPGYIWDRAKSNECVSRNRFSFYYARLVYQDAYFLLEYDEEHSTQDEDRWIVVGHPLMQEERKMLLLVEADMKARNVPGKVRIISAREVKNPKTIEKYRDNKKQLIANHKRSADYLSGLLKHWLG